MYRVLLVEDEEIIRKGIRYSVPWEEYGCTVIGEAENGEIGEEKIAELRPDIVITDITMPMKSGLEMIADTHDQYKYIAIILTGYSEFEYAQQAIHNGVAAYVLKPLDMEEMRSTSRNGRMKRKPCAAAPSSTPSARKGSPTRWCCAWSPI